MVEANPGNPLALRRCPICAASGGSEVFREVGVVLVRCPSCRHVHSTHELAGGGDHYWGDGPVEIDEESQHYWSTARMPCYRQFLSRYAADRGRIVDVGAGLGFFVKAAKDAGWDAHGWEMSRGAVAWGSEHLGLDSLHAGPVEEGGIAPGSIDVLTLWDVIEHLPDPVALLRFAHEVLRPGGLVFLQTPSVDFQLRRATLQRRLRGLGEDVGLMEARDHLNDFTPSSIRVALESAGFTDVRFEILWPTLSLAGGRSLAGGGLKLAWWALARGLFFLSRGRWNVSNTLHVTARA